MPDSREQGAKLVTGRNLCLSLQLLPDERTTFFRAALHDGLTPSIRSSPR